MVQRVQQQHQNPVMTRARLQKRVNLHRVKVARMMLEQLVRMSFMGLLCISVVLLRYVYSFLRC
jgi:hypothetical protein